MVFSRVLSPPTTCFLVILITGGLANGNVGLNSTELYNPGNGLFSPGSCSLPQLPLPRSYHTQDDNLVCGGGRRSDSSEVYTCDTWRPETGTWTKSHRLRERRFAHVSWVTDGKVFLMGSSKGSSMQSSEVIKKISSSQSSPGFRLRYPTR